MKDLTNPQQPSSTSLLADCVERRFYAEGRAAELGIEGQFLVPTPSEDMSVQELLSVQRELSQFEHLLKKVEHLRKVPIRPKKTFSVLSSCGVLLLSFVPHNMLSAAATTGQPVAPVTVTPAVVVRSPDPVQVPTPPRPVLQRQPEPTPPTPAPVVVEEPTTPPDTGPTCLTSGPNLVEGECCIHAGDRAETDVAHFRPDPGYSGHGHFACRASDPRHNSDGTTDVSRCNWCEP